MFHPFAMQNLDVAILYGKRMFRETRRHQHHGFSPCPSADTQIVFGEALERWSARFGAYGSAV